MKPFDNILLTLLAWMPCLVPAPLPARDVTFLSTSDSHYREPDHRSGNHNDLNRASIEEMNRITDLTWPEQLGGGAIAKPQGVVMLGDVILYIYGHSGTSVGEWAPAGEERKWTLINDGQTEVGFFVINITGDGPSWTGLTVGVVRSTGGVIGPSRPPIFRRHGLPLAETPRRSETATLSAHRVSARTLLDWQTQQNLADTRPVSRPCFQLPTPGRTPCS